MIKRRLRATLPGSVFKRGRRWWWRVQLPGEPEEKARSLRPQGERYGVTSLNKAGPVALAMWQRAIEREADRLAREKARIRARRRASWWARRVREVRQEARKALAERQAAYERIVEAHTQQAKSWNEKIQQANAEVDKAILVQRNECARRLRACKASAARAQDRAIAKIRAEANKTIAELKAEFEKKIRAYKRKTTRLWDRKAHQTGAEVKTEVKTAGKSRKNHFRRGAETHKKTPRKARKRKAAPAESKSMVEPILESTAVQQVAAEYAAAQTEIRKKTTVALDEMITSVKRIAYCQCCFTNGVPEEDLTQIDSGHRLCPGCMKALREKEAEIARLGI